MGMIVPENGVKEMLKRKVCGFLIIEAAVFSKKGPKFERWEIPAWSKGKLKWRGHWARKNTEV